MKPATSRYGTAPDAVSALLEEWGEPRYRSRQVLDGLWARRLPLDACTDLPVALRARLANTLPLALREVTHASSADGRTKKWLWALADNAQVETVLMESANRSTVCVSSQAGCAMGCTFCATGQGGFERHLDVGEIVEQIARAQHASSVRVSNVVFMGMGEPLANVEPVLAALDRLHAGFGLSARHLTVSTVGVVPGILRLADHPLPVTLAVSLHAPDDELRNQLVPLNRRYPLRAVLDAAATFAARRGRRVTFEYALIDGTNDGPGHADQLGRLLRLWQAPGGAHVNLIPLNPTADYAGRAPSRSRSAAFAATLERYGIAATVRRNRGVDIDAACGQLRWRERAEPSLVDVGGQNDGRPPIPEPE